VLGRLRPGGRLVANAVTLQSEVALALARAAWRRTDPHPCRPGPAAGRFDTWRQALPITLLDVVKPADA
jgi:precorrin-6Y C5,15-methyltransferase (decarboxylating)